MVLASSIFSRLAFFVAPNAGRQGIAGVKRHVLHRAALQAFGGTKAALRIDIPGPVAVLLRIGIDDAADGTVLLRELRLQSAPATAVAGDDDLAFDVDAAARQILVVIRHAVVDVDEIPGDVAIAAVDVVSAATRPSRDELSSPATGGSFRLATNFVGPTSSSVCCFSVG